MTEQVDTIIVGAGQAGLSTSYHLTQQGREHLILEQADQAAAVWRNRWDSFTLITPIINLTSAWLSFPHLTKMDIPCRNAVSLNFLGFISLDCPTCTQRNPGFSPVSATMQLIWPQRSQQTKKTPILVTK